MLHVMRVGSLMHRAAQVLGYHVWSYRGGTETCCLRSFAAGPVPHLHACVEGQAPLPAASVSVCLQALVWFAGFTAVTKHWRICL